MRQRCYISVIHPFYFLFLCLLLLFFKEITLGDWVTFFNKKKYLCHCQKKKDLRRRLAHIRDTKSREYVRSRVEHVKDDTEVQLLTMCAHTSCTLPNLIAVITAFNSLIVYVHNISSITSLELNVTAVFRLNCASEY